jgi:hypothetical protein
LFSIQNEKDFWKYDQKKFYPTKFQNKIVNSKKLNFFKIVFYALSKGMYYLNSGLGKLYWIWPWKINQPNLWWYFLVYVVELEWKGPLWHGLFELAWNVPGKFSDKLVCYPLACCSCIFFHIAMKCLKGQRFKDAFKKKMWFLDLTCNKVGKKNQNLLCDWKTQFPFRFLFLSIFFFFFYFLWMSLNEFLN